MAVITHMNNRRVDLNLINVFEAIMAERSVTRAARRVGMTQPAVSNALRRLRHLFRDELFVKGTGGVIPTDRAKALWTELEGPMAIVRNATFPARFAPDATTRTFRLAVTESIAGRTVPSITMRIAREAPGAKLHFVPHANLATTAALERGDIDCAVGMFPHPPPTLRVEGLLSDSYVCMFARRHRVLKAPLSLEAFTAARHVLVKQGITEIGIVDDWLSLFGLKRDIAIIVNTCADAIATAAESDFAIVVPESFIPGHPKRKAIQVAQLPFDNQKILYKLAWHERGEHDPAHIWFRGVVADAVRALAGPRRGARG
jgi:DNA-binding transcriptional LysR family regulator